MQTKRSEANMRIITQKEQTIHEMCEAAIDKKEYYDYKFKQLEATILQNQEQAQMEIEEARVNSALNHKQNERYKEAIDQLELQLQYLNTTNEEIEMKLKAKDD